MDPRSEIVHISSRTLNETNQNSEGLSGTKPKIEERVIQTIGMIVEECIDNSLQAGVQRMLLRGSDDVKSEDIFQYVKMNYGVDHKTLESRT
ncbi:hypothetical protein HWI79_904 [Cryptosporidium felis]|nr:hypothetical protein HWI79_904 [Cryptosporidium felis]